MRAYCTIMQYGLVYHYTLSFYTQKSLRKERPRMKKYIAPEMIVMVYNQTIAAALPTEDSREFNDGEIKEW